MGSKRPPVASLPDKKGKTELVGVRLMKEPGFAAPELDIHKYGRQGLITKGLFAGTSMNISHRNSRLPVGEIVKSTPALNAGLPNSPPQERRALSSVSFYTRSKHHPRTRLQKEEDFSQKYRSSPSHKDPSYRRRRDTSSECHQFEGADRLGTDFSSAIRSVPPVPQVFLKLLGSREVPALGKVRVSVRVSPVVVSPGPDEPAILSLDKKNHLVIVVEPKSSSSHIHRLGVSAPKIFSFDQVYSREDDQNNVVSKVVPDILQAVLGGNDGCILCFGGSGMGKSHTMVGSDSPPSHMGVMPYSISWLYQSVNHLKNTNAAKFSIRVSAVLVDASGKTLIDVLGPYAKESEISPGALLRQSCGGFLSSVTELRAPSPEVTARYLDLALNTRTALSTDKRSGYTEASTLLFTLHVYQQSIDSKDRGKVQGGRSRLHLMDLGDTSGHNKGSLSLSGITSVLLAIFNGKKYLPHKSNKLTQLLQEALGSVTCHASMIVHVSPSQRHLQHTLATLQLASRVHRLRRKKIKGFLSLGSSDSSEGSKRRSSGEETSAESSSIDFSSSELSADTVIYLGGGSGPGDSTDGEHPPVFLSHHLRRHRSVEIPRLRSMEQLRPHTASPVPIQYKRPTSTSPTPTSRSVPSNRVKIKPKPPPRKTSYSSSRDSLINSPHQPGFFRHNPGVSRVDYPANYNSRELLSSLSHSESDPALLSPPVAEKQMNYKFYQEPNTLVPVFQNNNGNSTQPLTCNTRQIVYLQNPNVVPISVQPSPNQLHSYQLHSEKSASHLQNKSSEPCISDEHWIDGPRISKRRVQAAKNTSKQPETWVDGPTISKLGNYGFMDDHKKTMIERWVENQTAQVVNPDEKVSSSTIVNHMEGIPKLLNSSSTTTLNGSLTNPAEDMTLESDVDTLSEDHSGALTSADDKQLNFIEELEKKSLIPVDLEPSLGELNEVLKLEVDTLKSERSSPEMSHGDEPSMDEICSQCEALAEECEEFNSLLACEEEECKRQGHQGLATVMEEPELESVYGGDYPVDSMSLLNNPQTDCEDAADALESSEPENSRWNQRDSIGDIKGRPLMSIRKTVDCAVQVYQEDIARALSNTPCPSDVSSISVCANDDHPLRVLSEENLSCASTFTDTNSHMDDIGDSEGISDEYSRPFSVFDVSEYGRLYEELHQSDFSQTNINCRELATIHEQFSALTQSKPPHAYDRIPGSTIENQHALRLHDNPFVTNKGTFFQDQIAKLEKDSCNDCNKKMRSDVDHISNIQHLSSITFQPSNKEQNRNCISRDKCTNTEEVLKPDNEFGCHGNRELVLNASSLYFNLDSYDGNGPHMDLKNDRSNINLMTNSGGNKPCSNRGKSTKYIKDVEENVLLCDPVVSFSCSCRTGFNSCDIHEVNPPAETCSDNDSDCHSSVSEDSEYIIKNSKLSRFLCVGIGKTKSKSTVKSNKAVNKNNDHKKYIFRFRDNRSKNNNNKNSDSTSTSDCQNSKNLIRSPPRTLLQAPANPGKSENLALVWQSEHQKVETVEVVTPGKEVEYRCDGFSDSLPSTQACNTPIDFRDIQEMSTPSENRKCWNEMSSTIPSCRSPPNCQDVPSNSSTTTKVAASHPMTTSGSLGTTQSLGESSGYESILRDSECSSFSSSQESEMDEEHRREARFMSRGVSTRKPSPNSSSPARGTAFFVNKTGDRLEDRLRHGDKRYSFKVIKRSNKK